VETATLLKTRAGFLEADDPKNLDSAKICVTELLSKVQKGLDVSLTFLASANQYTGMAVKPLFGVPTTLIESLDVFVLMPFNLPKHPNIVG